MASTTIDTADAHLQRKQSRSSGADSIAKGDPAVAAAADPTDVHAGSGDPEKGAAGPERDVSALTRLAHQYRVVVLLALAAAILGWWISSTVLTATRHRWYVARALPPPSPAVR